MSEQLSERIETTHGRSSFYGLLSAIFSREMNREILGRLRDGKMKELFTSEGIDLGEDFYNLPEEEVLEKLAVEYSMLYCVPGGVSPYESVYFTGLLFQEQTVKVKKFYQRVSFEVPEDLAGFPDHFGIELEFMHHLAFHEEKALKDGDIDLADRLLALQKEFLTEHLGRWYKRFLDVSKYASLVKFYNEFAVLAQEFISSEIESLGLTVKEIHVDKSKAKQIMAGCPPQKRPAFGMTGESEKDFVDEIF